MRVRAALAAGCGYVALYAAAVTLPDVVGPAVSGLVRHELAYLPLVALSIGMFVRAARAPQQDPASRRALWTLVMAQVALAAGMALYLYLHRVAGVPEGIANIGDPVYIAGYLILAAGLWGFPRRQAGALQRWKLGLDSITALVAAATLVWLFVIGPTIETPKSLPDLVVTVLYPLLDLGLLLTLNTIILAGGPATQRAPFRVLGLAVVVYVIADSLYQLAYYGPGRGYLDGISEFLYAAAYLLLAVAGWRYYYPDSAQEARVAPSTAVSFSPLPLLATGAVTLVLLVESVRQWSALPASLALAVIGLTILLMIRQGLTARENRVLLAEQAERRSEARVAALVRHASDLLLVCDSRLTITFASPSAAPILGTSATTLVGQSLAEHVHPEDLGGVPLLLQRLETAHGPLTLTWRMRHADGNWRPMETVATDLRGEPGVGGIVLAARDHTERTHLETQLRQAQKMEVVGRLAGGVAHDFNNLLTTMLASTEILLDQSHEHDPGHEYLLTIRQAAARAAGLTGQLLAFSRQQVLAPRPVEIEPLVRETLRMYERLAESAVKVELRVEGALPRVLGDPTQLTQVILNLALNARDAMPRGGTMSIVLSYATLTEPLASPYLSAAPGEYVTFAVTDTGAGMDDATRARLFEPFFTTKPAGKGTGLGLATTLSILEQHRGGITVEAVATGGTRMTAWLPATERAASDASAPAPQARTAAPAGRERILLVEDEAALRDVGRRILERLGYHVETAADAEQARRAIDVGGPPALLLTDVIMPGESGPQLANAMLRLHPRMRVLFISGYTGDELHQFGLRGGELAFLQKPFTPRELADSVREVLDAPWLPSV
ncbi:MAG: ATP-binding protein [Gemmatimonadota bacterium]